MDENSKRLLFFHHTSPKKAKLVANALSRRAGMANLLEAEALKSLRTGVVLKLKQQFGL